MMLPADVLAQQRLRSLFQEAILACVLRKFLRDGLL